MRIPLSWLAEHVALPEGTTPEGVHADLVRVGFEEESNFARSEDFAPCRIAVRSQVRRSASSWVAFLTNRDPAGRVRVGRAWIRVLVGGGLPLFRRLGGVLGEFCRPSGPRPRPDASSGG